MIVATIVCAIACLLLVSAERTHRPRTRALYKITASAAFVCVALACNATGSYATWIRVGLVLGAIGDVLLLGAGDAAFAAGLGAFLLGHVAYVVAIAQLVPPSAWLDRAGLYAALPIVVGALALARLWRRLGKLRAPVIVYVTTIVVMTVGALAARGNTRLAAGALLFFASDLAVARDKVVARAFANKAWGLPAYYAGQLLVAWSL